MSRISRRKAMGMLAGGAVGLTGAATVAGDARVTGDAPIAPAVPRFVPAVQTTSAPVVRSTSADIVAENRKRGSTDWLIGAQGTRAADDMAAQIKGYASATSVAPGGSIDLHVSVATPQPYTIEFYRLGHYGGAGARPVFATGALAGVTQPDPLLDKATGMIVCGWKPSYTLDVPADWITGTYVAVFTTASRRRSYTPFVVRGGPSAVGLAVVLPFTTYQAYNQWPLDDVLGKSLYNGYLAGEPDPGVRARKVSFDRPYHGDGLPKRFDDDRCFISWAEEAGLPVSYHTSIDLHDGRLDPSAYAAVAFGGHDEYWSSTMRARLSAAIDTGTSVACMAANNIYWHIRFEDAADGRPNRVVTCYKALDDPAEDRSTVTVLWRTATAGPKEPEQALLGAQYNGIVKAPAPLVVRNADHWFWAGTGVRDGHAIAGVVAGEADGCDPRFPGPRDCYGHTMLSSSPYVQRDGRPAAQHQNTSLYETSKGAVVFVAGTLGWTNGLAAPGVRDERIRAATGGLFRRMLQK